MDERITEITSRPLITLQHAWAIRHLSGWLRRQSEDTPNGNLPVREDIVAAARKIGQLWFGLHNPEMAVKFLHKALGIQNRVLGPKHPTTAELWNELGFAIGECRSAEEAVMCHQKSLLIKIRQFGADHFSLAECYDGIGLRVAGKVNEAMEFHKKAIDIRTGSGNEFHPDTIQSYNGMALCHRKRGDFRKAVYLLRRLHKIRKQLKGKAHVFCPKPEVTYHNLGLSYSNNGQYDKSIGWHERTIRLLSSKLNSDHRLIRINRMKLATAIKCLEVQNTHRQNQLRAEEQKSIESSFLRLNSETRPETFADSH